MLLNHTVWHRQLMNQRLSSKETSYQGLHCHTTQRHYDHYDHHTSMVATTATTGRIRASMVLISKDKERARKKSGLTGNSYG